MTSTSALAGGIQFFEGTWEKALAQAKAEDKLVFVDVYTQWCGPCKVMSKEVFSLDEVGSYYNSTFINMKLDAEDEDQNGPTLAEKYQVHAYPTLLFIRPNGDVVNRVEGGMTADAFIAFGKRVNGESDEFSALHAKIEGGDRSRETVVKYLKQAKLPGSKAAGLFGKSLLTHATGVAKEFLKNMSSEDLKSVDVFEIARSYFPARGENEIVEFIIENRQDYAELLSEKDVAEYIISANSRGALALAGRGDNGFQRYLDAASMELTSANAPKEQLEFFNKHKQFVEMRYALMAKDWDRYVKIIEEKVEKTGEASHATSLGATMAHSDCKDPRLFERLATLAAPTYEHNRKTEDPGGIMVYGLLLAKSGDSKTALKVFQDALSIAERKGSVGTAITLQEFKNLVEGYISELK